MFFKLILVPKFSSIEFVHVVFIQDKDKFPRHIARVNLRMYFRKIFGAEQRLEQNLAHIFGAD
jgi:hypothetical protein